MPQSPKLVKGVRFSPVLPDCRVIVETNKQSQAGMVPVKVGFFAGSSPASHSAMFFDNFIDNTAKSDSVGSPAEMLGSLPQTALKIIARK